MMIRFGIGDFKLLKSLTDEELAATFESLYRSAIFLKGSVGFRNNYKDIVCDVVELAEVVAEEIASRANLTYIKCNHTFNIRDFTFYTPDFRKWLNSQESVSNRLLPCFSFCYDLESYIKKASSFF